MNRMTLRSLIALIMQVGETWQLVDCNKAFGFRGSNSSTSGHAVQANPTSTSKQGFHKRKTILLYSTFRIMSRSQTGKWNGSFLVFCEIVAWPLPNFFVGSRNYYFLVIMAGCSFCWWQLVVTTSSNQVHKQGWTSWVKSILYGWLVTRAGEACFMNF